MRMLMALAALAALAAMPCAAFTLSSSPLLQHRGYRAPSLACSIARRTNRVCRLGVMKEDSVVDKVFDTLFGTKKEAAGKRALEEEHEEMFMVVVNDDKEHYVDEVVKIIRKTVGRTWKDSLDLTMQIGRKGSAIVYMGSKEDCERMSEALLQSTLKAVVMRDDEEGRKLVDATSSSTEARTSVYVHWVRLAAYSRLLDRWGEKSFRNGARPRVTLIGRNEKMADKLKRQLEGESFAFGGREWSTMRTKLMGSARAMKGSDLVIHTAGPFQNADTKVLQVAIELGITYMDVCDDQDFAAKCRELSQQAVEKNVTCMTTCGIYPGLSNVMASSLGTGGVGGTILASTFMLLAEPCQVYRILNIPNVDATFATAPEFWNVLLRGIVKVIPRKLLSDRSFASKFAAISLPINRLVDAIVGSSAAIRIDVEDKNQQTLSSIWYGRYLNQAVGVATAAMAMELLELQGLPAGVFYPEELEMIAPGREEQAEGYQVFLARASKDGKTNRERAADAAAATMEGR
ncbi:hypothetical protein GUITHDRAFT_162125 [Guillardia theta CCMP2712]|uniref:Saccharopine dehydrogenase NADP binding domain-containing protein n=1 Tax=Guillardia theta (strain CCMP2712) TaxID=905079 RepID=L1JLQ3_GUITC|nr:hypothetical protein GUITHDRAFT_162125 [Guillardia theta CCMP2712]EKX49272.1 hypothetical protein GUITHDRAFT_162125 [Guillardia theta CCMP2712]|eukprot:XP_005836252.1 hypothetical protein GUITHDRAFT_162125 [Guillardia theta CCMP2712]